VALPEGYKPKVKTIPLRVLGRAAALSGGRVADGRFELDEFDVSNHKKIVLAQHFAYRLTVPTLEPVARQGDILLVKEPGEPSAKSLVVALSDDRILARRFEIAENHSDVAVLTAQAINPRQIAPPVIAHKATFTLHKIVGVLYGDFTWNAPGQSEMEVCDCGGEAVFTGLAADALGLVEVVGQSAEPYALHGQYLVVKNEITAAEALKTLDGKPIIAADTDDNRYFKRLRIAVPDQIVLESLDSGGDYPPVVLASSGTGKNCLERVWPVAGVLFELPN
jgi:SOS-response transcriptional repressor LexA